MLGCYGSGQVMKFAEICAAVLLAGDTSLSDAIVHGDWVTSHDRARTQPTMSQGQPEPPLSWLAWQPSRQSRVRRAKFVVTRPSSPSVRPLDSRASTTFWQSAAARVPGVITQSGSAVSALLARQFALPGFAEKQENMTTHRSLSSCRRTGALIAKFVVRHHDHRNAHRLGHRGTHRS
jgi:hypothetical protein